jgi:DNA-binding response OmpR family regulator
MTRVLIIEPDAQLREVKEAQLRAAGYLVVGVADEEMAREAVRVSPYPLLVFDSEDALPLYAKTQPLNYFPEAQNTPPSAAY